MRKIYATSHSLRTLLDEKYFHDSLTTLKPEGHLPQSSRYEPSLAMASSCDLGSQHRLTQRDFPLDLQFLQRGSTAVALRCIKGQQPMLGAGAQTTRPHGGHVAAAGHEIRSTGLALSANGRKPWRGPTSPANWIHGRTTTLASTPLREA